MTRDTGWFKSSFSEAGNDNCIEVRITPDAVGVRDSKAPAIGEFWVPFAAWTAFLGTGWWPMREGLLGPGPRGGPGFG